MIAEGNVGWSRYAERVNTFKNPLKEYKSKGDRQRIANRAVPKGKEP